MFATEPEDFTKLDVATMKGIKQTVRRFGLPLGHRLDGRPLDAGSPGRRTRCRLRELASDGTIVLLDWTTNGDVTDLSAPLSHAALIAQRFEAPTPGRTRSRR